MRALRFYGNQDLRFDADAPEPKIGHPSELLLEVGFCGICGSDLHEFLEGPIFTPADGKGHAMSGKKLPQCMGHEFSGTVLEIGSEVTKFRPGDRVVVDSTIHCSDSRRWNSQGCKTCVACKRGCTNVCSNLGFTGVGVVDGAFAERVVVAEEHVIPIPDSIPLDIAALVEPLAVAWHAVTLANPKPGDSVLVLGCGPIGIATIFALYGYGVTDIIVSEPAKIRREQAVKLGIAADKAIDPTSISGGIDGVVEKICSLSATGEGVDCSFDASGVAATYTTSLRALTVRGRAVNIAIWPHVPVQTYVMDLTLRELSSTGSMCYTPDDFRAVVDAIASGKIQMDLLRSMITGIVSLEDGRTKGFDQLLEHKDKHIKILVDPKK